MAAFRAGFYAFATKPGSCVVCHATVKGPFFAAPDLTTAYGEAKPLVDFNNPDASEFVTYAGNNHCGMSLCSGAANEASVRAMLANWATSELAVNTVPGGVPGSLTPKYLTAPLAVPATLPPLTTATPAVMRFPLNQLSPAIASLSNAVLEIEIQQLSMGTYRINRAKIMGNSAAVSITGLHVYVKATGSAGLGVEDKGQSVIWAAVQATAPVSTLPGNLPVGPLNATPLVTDAIAVQAQSTADLITIGIQDIN